MKKYILSAAAGAVGMAMGAVLLYNIMAPFVYFGVNGRVAYIPAFTAAVGLHAFMYIQLEQHLGIGTKERLIGYGLVPVVILIIAYFATRGMVQVVEFALSPMLILAFLPSAVFAIIAPCIEAARRIKHRQQKGKEV